MSSPKVTDSEPEVRLGMTEAQWEAFQRYTRGFGEQDENGIDISTLRRNLRLNPAQRLNRLQQAVNTLPQRPQRTKRQDSSAGMGGAA